MAQPAVVFPDTVRLIVVATTAGLAAQNETVLVTNQVPLERPDELVTVRRVGGQRLNVLTDEARLSIDTWALTVQRAMTLAQMVRALVHGMAGTVVEGVPIYRVSEVLGPTELPDPESTSPRVAQTIQVAARGTGL